MTITFVSNYINHHQIPFSNAMYAQSGEDYCFIQTEPMEEERRNMGPCLVFLLSATPPPAHPKAWLPQWYWGNFPLPTDTQKHSNAETAPSSLRQTACQAQ